MIAVDWKRNEHMPGEVQAVIYIASRGSLVACETAIAASFVF